MIGYGFMGRAHSNAWRKVANFFPELGHRPVLQAVCARDAAKVQGVRRHVGLRVDRDRLAPADRARATSTRSTSACRTTAQGIALAAAANGKAILCEKPLAMDVAEGEAMVAAVERAGVPTMVWYNYRRVPSVSLARQLVEEGRIGRPYHYRAQFLQDWTIAEDLPQGGAALWRLDVESAGSGVTGDLLAHNIDTAMWLNGPITRVLAETETFVKERLHQETGKLQPVGIDDACIFICRFANGAMGVFESTRYARGHKALKTFELNGADGSVRFDLHEPEYLDYFEYRARETGGKVPSHTAGWRRIHVTNSEHPYMGHWWVPGLVIGYEHSFVHAVADFLKGLETGVPAQPDFRSALQTQKVCEAVLRSAESGRWEQTGVTLQGES